MSASSSAGSTGRNTSVAHFLAPDWGRIADRLAPVLDRDSGEAGTSPLALICVPDNGAAVELAAALRAARASLPRILPVTNAQRAARVIKSYGAPIVILTPGDAERMLAASALPLDAVQAIALVAADEFNAEELSNVMASIPKDARRILVASDATPTVEVLLERYFHKAHRLADDSSADAPNAAVQYVCVRGLGADAVPALLDDLDPPSAAIVTADAHGVTAALAAHGYPTDASLVKVTEGAVDENVALVIFAGLPSHAAYTAAMEAKPGRAIALIAPRQLAALRRFAGEALSPYVTRRATSAARAREERLRAELKQVLTTAYPAREILALEPMLAEFDGAELAGAALKLLDAARAAVSPAPAVAAAAPAARPAAAPRGDRPMRSDRSDRGERAPRSRDAFPLREPADPAKPRYVDRTVRRDRDDRPPRRGTSGDGERGPRRSFGDKPRSFGDKPRSFGDKPRAFGDKPRSFGDKPRGAGGFGKKRSDFGDKPRGTGPRGPRSGR